MKEKDTDSENENDSNTDITNLLEKKPHEINKNKNQEEEIIRETNINENNKSKQVENKMMTNNINQEKQIDNKKKELLTKKSIFSYDKVGNTYIFLLDKNNNPLITIGPHWIMFLICFLFITAGFLFLFIYYFKFLTIFLFIPGILIYLVFSYVYIYILLTDPGIPKRVNDEMAKKSKDKYKTYNYFF